jgi:uncharacterized delta-60 repeat protein
MTTSLARKAPLFLLFFALLLVSSAAAVRAQSALDGFDPNANGSIRAVVVQPDGKILIGGDFTSLAPNGGPSVMRNHIARLNHDGTLDSTFDPNANSVVNTIALEADGHILVGGAFTSIGPFPHSHIARIDPTNGVAPAFGATANGPVFSIAIQTDGKILLGGFFTSAGGQPRNNIARIDRSTGAADSFNPNANDVVRTILVQPDRQILVGGAFAGPNSIGGQSRNFIARLDPITGLADSFDPNASDIVVSLAIQADGKILIGGGFSSAFGTTGGQPRNGVARLNPITGLADSFNPNASDVVNTIALQQDGQILVGGSFTTISGQTRNGIARLEPSGSLDSSFNPNATGGISGDVNAIVLQNDDKILAGGAFTGLSGVPRNRIARLQKDGRLDRTLNLSMRAGDEIRATALQADGKILIGGGFPSVLGTQRNNVARLNSDGTLDNLFNPDANGSVEAIAVQTDGKILVGGFFTQIGNQFRNKIARLDATTGLADSFNPGANADIRSIAVQADGKILVGGFFTGIGNQLRNNIARLDATTGLADLFNPNASDPVLSVAIQADGKILAAGTFSSIGGQPRTNIARLDAMGPADSFNPGADSYVAAVALQADGKVLVGGNFLSIGGQARNRIARLDPVIGLADSFDPNASNQVYTIAVQADGKILAGGDFADLGAPSIGGQPRNRIARLDPVSGLADSFDPNANNSVYAIAVQADGKILVGGAFSDPFQTAPSIGGQSRNNFARVTSGSAAFSKMAVSKTSITWTRNGSAPQFNRVTFDYRPEGGSYFALGSGAASGNNWILSGLNLPTEQNIYVRARGYYRTGIWNGSESIEETVRNAFIGPVLLLNAVSRKFHFGPHFDIDLPLTGTPAVECRTGGANGDFEIWFTFGNTLVSVGDASVTSGTGSVSSRSIWSGDAHQYIVGLTGVTNAQTITVALTNVNDTTGNHSDSVSVSMRRLFGDTSGNGTVNATDVSQTKSKSGQVVDATNFRADVTVNGSINATDVSTVKLNSGTAVP